MPAGENRNKLNQATPTAFADWVFNLTVPNYQRIRRESATARTDRLVNGWWQHRLLDGYRKRINGRIGLENSTEWSVNYADSDEWEGDKCLRASALKLKGNSFACKPDVVFHNPRLDTFVIVERKFTSKRSDRIPLESYPNVRSQLWCYGWIDDWLIADNVYLIVEYWDWNRGMAFPKRIAPFPIWRRDDRQFHAECLTYFQRYGGQFCADFAL